VPEFDDHYEPKKRDIKYSETQSLDYDEFIFARTIHNSYQTVKNAEARDYSNPTTIEEYSKKIKGLKFEDLL
jgi:hypothetical protein